MVGPDGVRRAAGRGCLLLAVAALGAVVSAGVAQDTAASDATDLPRVAPLIVLRGSFRMQRLLDVLASFLDGGAGSLGAARPDEQGG